MKYTDMLAIFDARLKELQQKAPQQWFMEWFALFHHETHEEWIVDGMWPLERQIHIHAAPKTGKSLIALWVAGNVAIGRCPWTGKKREPMRVAYLDYEMTEDDLLERVEAMGFTPELLSGQLFYGLHPVLPPLDTPAGGIALMEMLIGVDAQCVILDTFARVVQGEENSNDTYRAFYKHTGSVLKAGHIGLMRLDHEGHTSGRSRGASAKVDDVDVVWQLQSTDDGLKLTRKQSRISWVPESLTLRKSEDDGLSYSMSAFAYPTGTMEKVRELDELGAPVDISRRKMILWLKERGVVAGKTLVLNAAMAYRNNRIMGV